ncbi:MAG: hypothetical protein KDD33_02010 [Bdellovibrionales bacterium]|nr:hypothetical protein [Bdellovibrionales bacterium]
MSFTIKKEEKDGKPFLIFSGAIDEEADFPQFGPLGPEVIVDLKEVQSINSVGIRSWLIWFTDQKETLFIFEGCPKAVVMQMNMVEGFLPEKSKVHSMVMPFYCEKCDKEIDRLFEVGKQILIQGEDVEVKFDASQICEPGCEPELDINKAKYLRFLVRLEQQNQAA